MSKIANTYPHPSITQSLNKIKSLGYDCIAQEIEKQIAITLNKGGALFHIARLVEDELERCLHDRSKDSF